MKFFFMSCCLLVSLLWGRDPTFVTPDLLQLLKVMEISHDGSAESIAKAVRQAWVRPVGKERWEIVDTLTPAQKAAVFDFCQKQRFFDELTPHSKEYDYAVILGGAVGRMEKRIGHFVKMVDAGVQFKEVILLAGARPLDPHVETVPDGCKTEGEALVYLFKAQGLTDVKWKLYEKEMIVGKEGKLRRPTTIDTYQLWLASSPKPGKSLFFSNQPYCHYQHVVAEVIMPDGFQVETVGMKADPSCQNGVVLLDTIAAWIDFEMSKASSQRCVE